MMKAAKLGWAGPGAGQVQGRSRFEQSSAEQGRKRAGLDRSWAGAAKELGRRTVGAGRKLELGRSRVGAELEKGRSRRVARWEYSTYQISPKLY